MSENPNERSILLDALGVDDLVVRVFELYEVHALGEFGDVVGLLIGVIKGFDFAADHVDYVDLGDPFAVADFESRGDGVGEDAEVFGRGLGREAQAEEQKKERE